MVIAKIKLWLITAGVVLGAYVVGILKGRSAQAHSDHERELNEYVETRRRLDETTIPNDAHAAREWLRKRAESGSDL